ncbi:MAG TPA: PEP-utilizing enzyme [Acidimicrobiales bacterium]|nr:PEP-utilizing enzyme [Acidimicrobiales bacterium]
MVNDPVDQLTCDPAVTWTSGNVAEAFPGVCTPLGFTFLHDPVELALRSAFHSIGAFRAVDIRVPPRIEDQFWTAFNGRAAANMTQFRALADILPGTSATAIEQQLFGYVRPGTVDHNSFRRYPMIAAKAPLAILSLGKRHDACAAELRTWWNDSVSRVGALDEHGSRRLLEDARTRLRAVMALHFLATFVGSGITDKVTALAKSTGIEGLEARLLTGVGSDENAMAGDLWQLAHGSIDMQVFLDRHGYHGPNEGQLDAVPWREDPSLLESRLLAYRSATKSPAQRADEQAATKTAAIDELVASIGRMKGLNARRTVKLSARFIALREQGKTGFLMVADVARAAARHLATLLAQRGALADAEDVFYLTWDELRDVERADDVAGKVATRRRQYAERQELRLPESWDGVPEMTRVAISAGGAGAGAGTKFEGLGAGGGVAQGRARVVTDPATAELDEGDILVCEATDPSWVSLFLVAGGVVTDLGGMLSHGAIVAREMGLPCVVGTKVGSATVVDGQRIRVNGDAGVVEILG